MPLAKKIEPRYAQRRYLIKRGNSHGREKQTPIDSSC
jgi:hypothetical protein